MTIQLVPGFKASVEIYDKKQNLLYRKDFPILEDLSAFVKTYGKSKKGENVDSGVIVPLRTKGCKAFSTDLFAPMLQRTIKIKNIAGRVFASVFAFAFDMATLPLRLIVAPFRICYSQAHPEKEHPLVTLIKSTKEGAKALNNTSVDLKYKIENTRVDPPGPPDEEGNVIQRAKKLDVEGTMLVALKRWPGTKKKISEKERSASYIGLNGEWILENSATGTSSYLTKHLGSPSK
jgi:hypothetical protein